MSPDTDIAKLRSEGLTPKAIARKLGLRPAEVTAAIQRLAAAAPKPELGEFEGAWISAHWTEGLGFSGDAEGWKALDPADHEHPGAGGLAQVLVARKHRYDDVAVSGYLVDLWCLGVKDALGPTVLKRSELGSFTRRFFDGHEAYGAIPLELAQAVILGAERWAQSLGLEPTADYAKVRSFLGADAPPEGLSFGRDGKPWFIQGPHDDVDAIVEKLKAAVGEDGFTVEEADFHEHDHHHHHGPDCDHDH